MELAAARRRSRSAAERLALSLGRASDTGSRNGENRRACSFLKNPEFLRLEVRWRQRSSREKPKLAHGPRRTVYGIRHTAYGIRTTKYDWFRDYFAGAKAICAAPEMGPALPFWRK